VQNSTYPHLCTPKYIRYVICTLCGNIWAAKQRSPPPCIELPVYSGIGTPGRQPCLTMAPDVVTPTLGHRYITHDQYPNPPPCHMAARVAAGELLEGRQHSAAAQAEPSLGEKAPHQLCGPGVNQREGGGVLARCRTGLGAKAA
jgi:hypothetical protein